MVDCDSAGVGSSPTGHFNIRGRMFQEGDGYLQYLCGRFDSFRLHNNIDIAPVAKWLRRMIANLVS